ncbi:MAG: hypothetical protein KF777_18505, partial [Planctomycetaceae bacterium]|nr:hypothetical protein [Planctomycetaceae bacterium]
PSLNSLKGVSGGPIFGFYDSDEGLSYWVVAIQSHSFENRFIFGCPVQLFGNALLDQFQAVLAPDDPNDVISRSEEANPTLWLPKTSEE